MFFAGVNCRLAIVVVLSLRKMPTGYIWSGNPVNCLGFIMAGPSIRQDGKSEVRVHWVQAPELQSDYV